MSALRVAGAAILWTLIALLALLASSAYHLRLPIVREVARDVLNRFVTGEIRGELRVGRFDHIGTDRVVARHVMLFDPWGDRVAVADTVVLTPDLAAARRGVLRFSSARLTGGTIRLIERTPAEGEEGTVLPTFIQSFEPADPTPGTGEPLHAIVDGILVEDTVLYGTLLGLDHLRVEQVRLTGRIEAEDEVEIRIYSGDGNVVSPFPFVGDVAHVSGLIGTDPRVGLRLHARGEIERPEGPSDQVAVNVTYGVPEGGAREDESHLGILVHGAPIHARFLEEVGYGWAESFEDDAVLEGHFRLEGPPEDLELRAWAMTSGGRLQLTGGIDERGVDVTVQTPGMDIARVVTGWPAVHVSGRGRMQIDTADEGAPARIRVEGDPFAWEGFALPTFVLEGDVHEDHLVIDSVRAPYAGGDLSGSGRYDFDGRMDVRVRGNVPQVGRDPNIRRYLPDVRGRLSAFDLRVRTGDEETDWFRVDGRLVLRNFRYGPVTAERVVIDGWVGGHPDRPQVQVQVDGTEVAIASYPLGHAEVDVDGGPARYQASGRFQRDGPRQLEFDATIDRAGRAWVATSSHLELAIDEQRVWRGGFQQLVYDSDSIRAEQIRLASGSQRLEASGVWRFRGPEEIRAQLQDFDLDALHVLLGAEMPDVTGRLDTSIELTGDISQPNVVAEGFLREGTVYGIRDVTLLYAIAYEDGNLTLDGQVDLGARGGLTLSGTGMLDPGIPDPVEALENGIYDLELGVSGLTLDVPREVLGDRMPPVQGVVGGTIRLEGPIFAPTLAGTLTVPALVVPGFPPLEVQTTMTYDSGVLNARVATRDGEGELVESEGSLVVDLINLIQNPEETLASLSTLPWRVAVRMPARLLGELPGPLRELVPEDLHPIRASVSGTLAGGGFETRGDLIANLEWAGPLTDVTCEGGGRPTGAIEATLVDGVTTARGRLFVGGRQVLRLTATGRTPVDEWLQAASIDAMPEVRLVGLAQNVPLEQVPLACELAQGPLTAALEVDGLFGESPEARIELHSAAVRILDTQPVRLDANITLGDTLARGTARISWWSGERAEVEGRMPIAWGGERWMPEIVDGDVLVTGDFQGAPIGPFLAPLPQIDDVAGYMDGQVRIEGPLDALRWTGGVTVYDGYLELVGLGQHLTDVSGEVVLHGNWARLAGFRARDGEGVLRLDGSLGFDGWRPARARLALNANRFPARREGTVLATLTGNASLSAAIGVNESRMELEVHRLDVRLPEEETRSVQPLERHPDVEVVGAEGDGRGEEDPYAIHIDVDATTPFWVRRNDFAALVTADLKVAYIDPDLFVRGDVVLRRGFFEVFGKRFNIDRGNMHFDGGREIDPEVILVATHEMRLPANTTVTVTVTGTLTEPSVEFRSTHPDCDERAEVVTMLVSGRCTLAESNRDQQLDAAGQAANVLAGITAGVLTLSLRREFGDVLPVIAVETGDTYRSGRIRAGFDATSVVPEFLRGAVRGAYVEGVVAAGETEQRAGGSEGGQIVRPGFLMELQFPYDLVLTGEYEPPSAGRLDLTWEP